MKKLFFTCLAATALLINSTTTVKAQSYKTGLGLAIDFGNGATLVGPHIKHFFNANGAINGEVLFANRSTFLQAMYQYHGQVRGASGLKWYVGGGPSIQLYDGGSSFYLVPMTGLDLKFKGAPLAASFDWRPRWYIGDNNSDFNAGRFGFGFRYTF